MMQTTSISAPSQVSFTAPRGGVIPLVTQKLVAGTSQLLSHERYTTTADQIISFASSLFSWERLNIGRGLLSLFRYGGLAIASKLPLGRVGMGASALGVVLQGKQLTENFSSVQKAREIGDTEGLALKAVKMGEDGVMTVCSAFSLTGLILEEVPSLFAVQGSTFASTIGPVFSLIGNVLLGIGSTVGLALSGVRLYQLNRFGASLKQLRFDPQAANARECAHRALDGLSKFFTITEQEQEGIKKEIARLYTSRDLSSEDARELFSRKLLDLAQVKIQAIKRRSSMKSVELLAIQVPDLLARLESQKSRAGAIQETVALIETLRKENSKKTLLFAMAFVVSLIAFGAFLAAFIFGGVLPFALLFIATAVTIVSFAVHNRLIYNENKSVTKLV